MTNTNQFIVSRDGQLDTEWLESAIAFERQEALRSLAKDAVAQTLSFGLRTAQKAGMLVLDTIDELVIAAN